MLQDHPSLPDGLPRINTLRLQTQTLLTPKNSDLVLTEPPEQTAAAARELLAAAAPPTREQLAAFVAERFAPAGSDLRPCALPGWQPEPPELLARLPRADDDDGGAKSSGGGDGSGGSGGEPSAGELRAFALRVHALWPVLARAPAAPPPAAGAGAGAGAGATPAYAASSLLPLPFPAVVPGDRFRETYYWDSLWIVRGLLASGLPAAAAGVARNLLHMLAAVGHVPNGARCYYLNRSQPPLLSAAVRGVFGATRDRALLEEALPRLAREAEYWTTGAKAVLVEGRDGRAHALSRYCASWRAPRPESYREDAATADAAVALAVAAAGNGGAPLTPAAERRLRRRVWRDLASAAESGWDFSSRWLEDGKTLATVQTTRVVPADLNAFVFRLLSDVAWMARELGDAPLAARFEAAADARAAAIDAVLWDGAAACWRDGVVVQGGDGGSDDDDEDKEDLPSGQQQQQQQQQPQPGQTVRVALNPAALASNYVPLWAGLTRGDEARGERVVASLEASGLVLPGGALLLFCLSPCKARLRGCSSLLFFASPQHDTKHH